MMKIMIALMALALITPAMGQNVNMNMNMTDYQKGVVQGLSVGLQMGQLLGAAKEGNATAAQEYNRLLPAYNKGIISIFGNNQGLYQLYALPEINQILDFANRTAALPGEYPLRVNQSTTGVVHKIDGNQGSDKIPQPDSQGQIHGYPAEAYYMMGPDAKDIENIRAGERGSMLGGA